MAHGTAQAIFGLGDDADSNSVASIAVSNAELTAARAADLAVQATYYPLYSKLTADSAAVNNSTALVASGLTVDLLAGTYDVEAVVVATTAAAADLKLQFGGTATVTATIGVSDIFLVNGPGGADGTVAFIPDLFPTSWTTARTFATTGALADDVFVFKGTLVVTVAGTLTLTFAQGTADLSDTRIEKGSYLVARKVA